MDHQSGPDDTALLLGLLSAVERDSRLTQRSLARELGVALGMANAYVKRCANKGLIKIRQAPLNRYAYYLTPKGLAEKSRLTAEYLSISFNFFRDARRQCSELFAACAAASQHHLVLVGAGDLAEIAVLSSDDADVKILCIIDRKHSRDECAGRPVIGSLEEAMELAGPHGGIDAFVVTDVLAPQSTFEWIARLVKKRNLPLARIHAPPLLRISCRFESIVPVGQESTP